MERRAGTRIRNILFIAIIVIAATAYLYFCFPGMVTAAKFTYNPDISNAAKSAYNKTVLFLLGEEIALPDTSPVTFDRNAFVSEATKHYMKDTYKVDFYWHHYDNYQALKGSTGFILPVCESLKFESPFIVYLYAEDRTGYLNTTVQYDSHNYNLKGVFKISDYTEESTEIGLGQGDWATSIYRYADEKEAFFIRNWGYDEYKIYFEAKNVLYELTIPNIEEDLGIAKEIVEAMESGTNE